MADQAEIVESLAIEDVPVKLRCAACNKLAQEAVRMPCCDQNICADCQANKLDTTCPICYHEPISADDCRPNKALRQTIKVFLKKKIIERDNARKQEALQKVAAESVPNSIQATGREEDAALAVDEHPAGTAVSNGAAESGGNAPHVKPESEEMKVLVTAPKDIPQPSVESPGQQSTPRRASTVPVEDEAKSEKAEEAVDAPQANPPHTNGPNAPVQGINAMNFDPTAMASMGMSMSDMNPMMLQMMQNGLANPMMAGFPNMMGMTGMGMDPMSMSQGMFNNLGGPGMMNGMNMGMGFDAGQGVMGGGFSGQPQGAWNSGGQNKFNQNGFGGNFNANAGYGAGYNMPPHQGNFNPVHHANYPQSDFHQHGHHNQGFHRGRGRGRGGYPYPSRGRGNFHQVNQNHNVNHDSSQQEHQGPIRRGSPVYTPMNGDKAGSTIGEHEEQGNDRDEFAPGDAEDRAEEADALTGTAFAAQEDTQVGNTGKGGLEVVDARDAVDPGEAVAEIKTSKVDALLPDAAHTKAESAPSQAERISSVMPPPPSPSIPNGHATDFPLGVANAEIPNATVGLHGRGFTRIPQGENASTRGQQQLLPDRQIPPSEPRGMGVVGAPTGPKAMRQKQFNPNAKSDPGFSIFGRAAAARTKADGGNASPRRSRSRSRSPAETHSSQEHRRHNARSRSPVTREDDISSRKESQRRHSRRYDDRDEYEEEYKRSRGDRKREHSVESSKKSSRRSHRDHDRERDRDYERDKGRKSGRSHRHDESDSEDKLHKRSSHRHHRDSAREGKDTTSSDKSRRSSHNHHHRSHDKDDDYPTSSSSGKRRRSRDEYEDDLDDTERTRSHHHHHHRSSKRSKHSSTAQEDPSRSRPSSSSQRKSSITAAAAAAAAGLTTGLAPSIPTGPRAAAQPSPKLDTHALEREKRDRERQMKELQRRALAHPSSGRRHSDARRVGGGEAGEGGGGEGGIRINGAARRRERKISVRYEDELEDLGR